MTEDQDDSFNASKAEIFEALSHPTRINILRILSERPLPFSGLKRTAGLESNGLLTFHLGKLRDLVKLNPEGVYALTDEGKEALRIIEASRTQPEAHSGQGLAFHLPHQKAILAGLLVVMIALGSVAVYQQEEIAALSLGASGASSVLRFNASVNSTSILQTQGLRVEVSDRNSLYFTTQLPLLEMPGIWKNLSMGPCSSFASYPYGIGLYPGRYTLDNISSATSLEIYAPGFYACPAMPAFANSITFKPLQNISGYVDLQGYWTAGQTAHPGGGFSQGVLHPFLPGVYTLVARDLWGHTKLLYIQVNGPTGNLERTGPVSRFPNSWLDPCNQSGAGNVTTAVYLGLNASSVFDHINLDQVYAQIVDSSSFIFKSTGHGWVVTEWVEVEGAGGNTSAGDEVVGSFILTSDGTPSGYVYADYNLASGSVVLNYAAAIITSCPA